MKRIALVLAAVFLGTGCIVMDDDHSRTGTIDVAWWFVRTRNDVSSSQVSYDCSLAGIDTVVVDVPSRRFVLPCFDAFGDGAAVLVPSGTQRIVITAYRGGTGGVALYASQLDVSVGADSVTYLDAPLYGRFGTLEVNANFQNLAGTVAYPTCASAGVNTISFRLVDSAGTTVYASGNVACGDPPGLTFGAGNEVDLDDYTIRVVATGPSFYFDSAVPASCSSPVFGHHGNDTGSFAWELPVYDLTGLAHCP